ncbi:MAG TPA: glutamate racemase, partial [Candidatus Limnocylindrales bacterium]|nr:glutamate racemase [Candidatus Limnocylindrales bacterium]
YWPGRKGFAVTLPRIGVFDSGVGGLTVLKAMAEQLPAHYLYFGDTARLPYGTKSAETVARYAIGATRFLEAQNIDLLVIACNTATALAFPLIQEAAHVPVVGVVEPGAAMAAEVSKSRSAIVIATEATVSSHAYRDALRRHGLAAHEKACPLFVPLVEEGWIEHPVTEQVARIYLGEALLQAPEQADVLVLACTHYPLIAPLLRRIAPDHMQIVDSAESTARVVRKMLKDETQVAVESDGSNNQAVILSEARLPLAAAERSRRTPINTKVPPAEHRTFRFYVTDSTGKFKRLAARFLGRQVDNVEHVDLGG